MEIGHTCSPTASWIQWKVSGGSGEPVEAIARSAREVVPRAGGEAGLGARGQVAGARAVHGRAGRAPRPRTARRARGGAGCRRRARSPSRPAGRRRASSRPSSSCGVEEEAVVRAEVEVQRVVADVVEQLAAVAVDDPLRRPGGARGEEHVERVVEGDGLEDGRRGRPGQGRPRLATPGGPPRPAARPTTTGMRRLSSAPGDLGHGGPPVVGAPAVAIAVAGDQRRGTQLGEAIERAGGCEVGRAGRPDRADAGARQVGDHRLGAVGQVAGHHVAAADAALAQAARDAAHGQAQLVPAQLAARARLVDLDHRGRARLAGAQRVLGVVEPRALEPARSGHLAVGQHRVVGGRAGCRSSARPTPRSPRGRPTDHAHSSS